MSFINIFVASSIVVVVTVFLYFLYQTKRLNNFSRYDYDIDPAQDESSNTYRLICPNNYMYDKTDINPIEKRTKLDNNIGCHTIISDPTKCSNFIDGRTDDFNDQQCVIVENDTNNPDQDCQPLNWANKTYSNSNFNGRISEKNYKDFCKSINSDDEILFNTLQKNGEFKYPNLESGKRVSLMEDRCGYAKTHDWSETQPYCEYIDTHIKNTHI